MQKTVSLLELELDIPGDFTPGTYNVQNQSLQIKQVRLSQSDIDVINGSETGHPGLTLEVHANGPWTVSKVVDLPAP